MRHLVYYFILLLFLGSCSDNKNIKFGDSTSIIDNQWKKETDSINGYVTNVISKRDLKKTIDQT